MMFFILLSALAGNETKNAECRVACGYIGYQTGGYTNNMCYCADYFEYEKTVGYKKTVLPTRTKREDPIWKF